MHHARGGGKRAKASDDVGSAPLFVFVPKVEDSDTNEMKACINMQSINIETIVTGMELSTLENFYTTILENPKTGNISVFTKVYLPFVMEIAALQVLKNNKSVKVLHLSVKVLHLSVKVLHFEQI